MSHVYYLASREWPCARVVTNVPRTKRTRTIRIVESSTPGVPEWVSVNHVFDSPEEAASLTMNMLTAKHKALMEQAMALEQMMNKALDKCIAERAIIKGDPNG